MTTPNHNSKKAMKTSAKIESLISAYRNVNEIAAAHREAVAYCKGNEASQIAVDKAEARLDEIALELADLGHPVYEGPDGYLEVRNTFGGISPLGV